MIRTSLSLALLLAACTAAPPSPAEGVVEPAAAERVPSDLQARLAEMFPEIRGPVTRESIAAALAPSQHAGSPASDLPPDLEAAIAARDLERAHAILSEALTRRYVERGRKLLEAGSARDALAVLDLAVARGPADPEALRLRGESALAVGLETADPAVLEGALASFRAASAAGSGPRAWLGASRAARELGRTEEAIECARRALGSSGEVVEASVSIGAQRALSQATYDLYLAELEAGSARAAELYASTRAALERLVERAPDDPWGWLQLASLLEQHGSVLEASYWVRGGLEHSPADRSLHQRLADLRRSVGGSAAVLETYEAFRREHPDVGLGWWHPGVEHFEAALAALKRGQGSAEAFEEAEREFARCRSFAPSEGEACLGYEAMCRSGVGWCRLQAGDLERAHQAFLSMDDLLPGVGLARAIPDRLESGVRGLAAVAKASNELGEGLNSLERAVHMERAAKISDFLHEYEPASLDWATKAGAFNRDTAVLLEQRARALERQGEVPQANRLLARAREMMERSYRAYADACALAPDDVRIANETGRVLTDYLQRDAPQAEEHLTRAVRLGEAQVPAGRERFAGAALSEEERERGRQELEALEIALGDAYQNLGVLFLTLKGDPRAARRWFAKALSDGGPDRRPEVDGAGGWLEKCDRAEAGRLDPLVRESSRWAAPIAERR